MSDSIERNVASYYLSAIIPSATSYIFWIIVANLTNPGVVGVVAAIGAFSMLLGVISGVDVNVSMRTFLGKAVKENDWSYFKHVVSSSILFTSITAIAIVLIAINPFFNVLSHFGIENQFIPIIIAIVIGNSIVNVAVGAIISSLKSKKLVIPYVIATLGKIVFLGLLYSLFEISEYSTAWAFASLYIILAVLLLTYTLNNLRKIQGPFFYNTINDLKFLIRSGSAKWIPDIILALGTQLSILVVFSIRGASEGGLFYISFALFGVLLIVSKSMVTISHPVLSGIENLDKQKKFLTKTLKFSFLGTMPLGAILLFYAKPILSIFGEDFTGSSDILFILTLSIPLVIISDAIYFLFYARGMYKNVFFLGLSSNVPRIILYFVLVPEFGAEGGAIGFIVGSGIQMILTIILIERIKFRLQYVKFFLISIIPFAIGYFLDLFSIGVFGVGVIILLSVLIYLKLKLIDEDNIEIMLRLIMNKNKAKNAKDEIVIKLKRIHLM